MADEGRGGGQTGSKFDKSQRAVENRENCKRLVTKSSVVHEQPSRLRMMLIMLMMVMMICVQLGLNSPIHKLTLNRSITTQLLMNKHSKSFIG